MADKPLSFSALLAGKPQARPALADEAPAHTAPAAEAAPEQVPALQAPAFEAPAGQVPPPEAPTGPAIARDTGASPTPATLVTADPAPTVRALASEYRMPAAPTKASHQTPARLARPTQAPALPAMAYAVEGIDQLRTYVGRAHWVDDVLFPQMNFDVWEQALLRRLYRLTLGFGRVWTLCGNEKMSSMTGISNSQLTRTRNKLEARGLIEVEIRIHGPVTERGLIYRLLPPAIPPDAMPAILAACAVEAPPPRKGARLAPAGSASMKGNESEVLKWTVDRLQTIAVQMVDDARISGEGKPTVAQIEREIRMTLRRVGAQAGVDFQDADVISIATKWGREGD